MATGASDPLQVLQQQHELQWYEQQRFQGHQQGQGGPAGQRQMPTYAEVTARSQPIKVARARARRTGMPSGEVGRGGMVCNWYAEQPRLHSCGVCEMNAECELHASFHCHARKGGAPQHSEEVCTAGTDQPAPRRTTQEMADHAHDQARPAAPAQVGCAHCWF